MVGAFLVLDVFGLVLLSRFIGNPGFVTFRQTFVRRCQNCMTCAATAGRARSSALGLAKYLLTDAGEFDILPARSRLDWMQFDQLHRREFITHHKPKSSWLTLALCAAFTRNTSTLRDRELAIVFS
jgi:hypothetical protein